MTADYNGWQDIPEEEREALLDTAALIVRSKQQRSPELLKKSFLRLPMRGVFPVLSVLSVVLLLSSCTGGEAQPVKPHALSKLVRVAPIIDTTIARPVLATGTVAPRDEIALSFKVGGVIARVAVDPGDIVRAGQVLATLELREIDAGLAKARSGSTKAERDLARARRLYRDSVVTLSQLQDSETAAELARADLDAAAFNRRYAVIVAPGNGTILRRSAQPGETVSPGSPVLTLGSATRGKVVELGLADRDVVSVRKGDRATMQFAAFPGRTFAGRITQIDGSADPVTGAFGIEIAIQDATALAAGLVGQVEIHPTRGMAVQLVPIEAVLEADGSNATVFALSPDRQRAERRRVSVAFIDGSQVAISGGLEGFTTVLTDGAAYLDDSSAVEVAR
jgi:membrane fusion protein, multidrug efflux system